MTKKRLKNKFLIEQLEQRLMFSADFEPISLDNGGAVDTILVGSTVEEIALLPSASGSHDSDSAEPKRQEILFVDSSISNYRQLVDDVLARSDDGRSIDVVVLDINKDGILQISETLGNYKDLDAVHIVSHGDNGAIRLGNDWLMKETLDDYSISIEGWREALDGEADILFYGCDLAAGEQGRDLIDSLTFLTGADVAASDDLTGSAGLGGDWELEYTRGEIETGIVFSAETQKNWNSVLVAANFQDGAGGYTSTLDTELNDSAPDTGIGTNIEIELDNNPARQGLLRFDDIFGNGPNQIPFGAVINSASLTVDVSSPSVGGANITLHRMLVDWTEGSTWNSLTNGIQTGSDALVTADSTLANPNQPGSQTFTGLEETLQAWSDGHSNYGWLILNDNNNPWKLYSSDAPAGNRPMLNVDYTPSVIVTTTEDIMDGNTNSVTDLVNNPGADGMISLREAVIATNNTAGDDRIILSSGTYSLTRAMVSEEFALWGDLDIRGNLTIQGDTSSTTAIDASSFTAQFIPDRVFEIQTGATLTLTDLTVRDGDGTFGGGALINTGGALILNNTVFEDNIANNGGAIQNKGSLTVNTSVFRNNTANQAGAIDNRGTLNLTDVEFIGNTGGNAGGALNNSNFLRVTNVTFSGNSATRGGALYNSGAFSDVIITNTTISGNTATNSGAGIFTSKLVDLINVTLAYNTATLSTSSGGGVYLGGSGAVQMKNTIIANNNAAFGNNTNFQGGMISLNNNLVDDLNTIASPQNKDKINTDPLLNPTLQNNGGFTSTHALLNGSPAINAGTKTGAPDTDQRGYARDSTYDIGAFEASGTNSAPTAISLDNATVNENAAGAVIGNLSTTDPDSGDSHTYTVNDTRFEVVAGQLKLKTGLSLDHETEPTVDILVTSTDLGGLSTNQLFTITVQDLNETPAAIALDNTSVDENADGAVIGNLSTTDPDSGDSHTYTVDDIRFEVVAGQLKLKVGQSLNYETESTVTVVVTSTDSGLLSTNQSFNITVNDKNEAPTAIALDNLTVDENADGAVIGNMSTTDPDSGDTHTYTVDDIRFEVVAEQLKLKAGQTLDFEAEPAVDLTITSTDAGLLNANRLFTISVANANEAPTAIALDNLTVDENADGAVIGNLNTTDPDSGDTHTYTVDDIRFEVVAGQLRLKAGQSLDFEAEPTVDVTVTSTDAGLLSSNQLFTITVNDQNETPTAIALDNLTVDENAAGAVIGNLTTTDPDSGDSHTYTVDDIRFEVVSGQLKLKAGQSLNFETEPTVDVTVTSTDAGLLSSNQLFTITVNDQNEAPTAIALDNLTVDENADGTVIGNLSTTDPDSGDTHTYTVDDVRFEVAGGQLKLKAGQSLDHETEQTVSITVTSTDAGLLSTNQGFVITVNPLNDNTPLAVVDSITVSQGGTATILDSSAASVLTNDSDADLPGDTLTAVIDTLPNFAAIFSLNNDGTFSYTHDGSANFNDSFSYYIDDGTNISNTITVNITITTDLVLHYTLDDGAGFSVNDSSVNNHDGTLIGDLGWTGGEVNGALQSDYTDATDDYVEAPNSLILDNVNEGSYTLSAWFRPDSVPPGINPTDNDYEYGILVKQGNHVGLSYTKDQKFHFTHRDSIAGAINIFSTNTFAPGTFYHVVGIVDVATGSMELFINGQSEGTTAFAPNPGEDLGTATWKVGIAAPGAAIYRWAADGVADDVRIYNKTLNASEISTLYELGNDAPTGITLDDTDVDENKAGEVIGNLTTTDPDTGDSHTYTVDDARFEVVAGQLKLKAGQSLDYEAEPTVDVTVTSTDAGGLSTNQLFTLTVDDENESPTGIALDNSDVDENNIGAVIGNLSTTDPDAGDSHTYTVDDARFEVVGGQLKLKFDQSLDYETEPTVDVTVTSNDGEPLSTNQLFTITVNNENEAPTAIALDNTDVDENNIGAVIGNLSTTDPEAGDTHTYTVDDVRFEVVGGQLKLKFDQSLDYETEPSVDVTVTSNDGEPLSTNQLFTITVNNVNEAPTAIALDNTDVDENDAAAVIGSLSTTDPDSGDSHTYTVDDARFEVVAGQLKLRTGQSLNHETEATVDVTVTSNDGEPLSTNQLFTITVNDVNDAPTGITLDNTTVNENADGAVVGNLTTADPDSGDSHTYALSDARFEVVSGQLKLKAGQVLDYETEPVVNINITSTDSGGKSISRAFAVTVNDVPNEAPTAIALDNSDVDEHADGAVIGNLTTADPDAGDTHTYTVDDTRFEVVGGELKLKAGQSLDYETESVVLLRVTSTDAGGLSTNHEFTITVNDVNEAPTGIILINRTVVENADGALIDNISTNDPDSGDSHTYSVDDVRFEVVGGQLKLKAGQSLDRETEPTVTVTVTSTDSGLLSLNKVFTITVTNVNESPTGITLDNTSVDENNQGAVIGNLTTADPDNGDTHSYAINDARFEVVGGKLRLRAGQSLDYEKEPTVEIIVTGTDAGGISIKRAFTINVRNVNDAPTATNLNVGEHYSPDTPLDLTDIVVSDVDSAVLTVMLKLSDPAAGALSTATSGSMTSTYNASTGVWRAKGLIADVNALLEGVVFIPADGFSSDFTITTIVKDGKVHKITGKKNMTFIPVVDPPADPVPVDELPEPEPEAPEEPEEVFLPEEPLSNIRSGDEVRETDHVRDPAGKKPSDSSKAEGIIGSIAEKARANLRSIINDISSAYRALPFDLSITDPAQELFVQEIFNDELLIKTYNRMRDSLDLLKNETISEIQFDKMVVGSTIAASTGLSVGYVIWLIRSGMLLTSVLASMPAWQIADPLPILSSMRGDDDDDDESLEDMLKKSEEKESREDSDEDE